VGDEAREHHRVGVTPVLKRLAFSYLKNGVGTWPIRHPLYDAVVVKQLYDWTTLSDTEAPGQGAIVVEFHRQGRRIRWVEFAARVVGAGGEPIVREV
jgi:hypothetical protein